jgi:hypothetical protein
MVTNGTTGQEFIMTATSSAVANPGPLNTGALRVGRILDRFIVLYPGEDPAAVVEDLDITLEGTAGQWYPITVKAVSSGAVMSDRGGFISVTPSAGLVLAATAGGEPATVFPVANGVSTFYVSSAPGTVTDIKNGCVEPIIALNSLDPSDIFNGINMGSRCGINFDVPSTKVRNAVVYGDGIGRPDSIAIRYISEGSPRGFYGDFTFPDSIQFRWPTTDDAPITVVLTEAVNRVDTFTIGISLRAHSALLPTGHTSSPVPGGRGLVSIFSNTIDVGFDVLDGMGPIISATADDIVGRYNPGLLENPNVGVDDTLFVWLSEGLAANEAFLNATSLLYSPPSAESPVMGVGGTPVNITPGVSIFNAAINAFQLVIPAGSGIEAGGWLRINPASTIQDRAANTAHEHPANGPRPDNRWVQIDLREVPAVIDSGYYTADVTTGLLDYAYITFSKNINFDTWFNNGYFRFSSILGNDSAASVPTALTPVDGNPRQLRVDLSVMYPLSRTGIMTGPGLTVNIGANPMQGWPVIASMLTDRAKPVLAENVQLKYGGIRESGEPEPDTLIVTYSETMSPPNVTDLLLPNTPVIISQVRGGSPRPEDYIVLELTSPNISMGDKFWTVSYLIAVGQDEEVRRLRDNDSVFINYRPNLRSETVGDVAGNIQDQSNNRKVPLSIDRGPLRWTVTVKNNPFRDGGTVTIIADPLARGAEWGLNIDGRIRLYDNLGNLVIDKPVEELNAKDGVIWEWDGRNSKGRMVGSGTYLYRATFNAAVVTSAGGDTDPPQRTTISRSIGFVKGRR